MPFNPGMSQNKINTKIDEIASKGKDLVAKAGEKLSHVAHQGSAAARDAQAAVERHAKEGEHRTQETVSKAGHQAQEFAAKVSHSAQETAQKVAHRVAEAAHTLDRERAAKPSKD